MRRQLLYLFTAFRRRNWMKTNALGILYATRQTIFVASVDTLILATFPSHVIAQSAATQLRIGVVTSRGPATRAENSILNGIRLGSSEASQTAKLFGDGVEMFEA